MTRVGSTLRLLRKARGLSQTAAAEALGITQVHVSRLETDKAHPSPEMLAKFEAEWGVDVYALAWLTTGGPDKLPEAVRGPLEQAGAAWWEIVVGMRTGE